MDFLVSLYLFIWWEPCLILWIWKYLQGGDSVSRRLHYRCVFAWWQFLPNRIFIALTHTKTHYLICKKRRHLPLFSFVITKKPTSPTYTFTVGDIFFITRKIIQVSVAKKPTTKYVWNMLDYNYSKYIRKTHYVQHKLKKRMCYSALWKKFEKFQFFFQSA